MAAESNPDAQVPVALAMVKLGAYFTLDWAQKVIQDSLCYIYFGQWRVASEMQVKSKFWEN